MSIYDVLARTREECQIEETDVLVMPLVNDEESVPEDSPKLRGKPILQPASEAFLFLEAVFFWGTALGLLSAPVIFFENVGPLGRNCGIACLRGVLDCLCAGVFPEMAGALPGSGNPR